MNDIQAAATHIFLLFFHSTQKKVKKVGHAKKNFPTPQKFRFLIQTPKVHFSLFFHFGRKWGVVSGGPQRGSQSCKTPRNPLFGVLYHGIVCWKEYVPWENV